MILTWQGGAMKTIIMIFLLCFSHSAIADTYKCVQSGRTIYSTSPCGDDAQVVQDHITISDGLTSEIYQKQPAVETAPTQSSVSPIKTTIPVKPAKPFSGCDYEEATFESVKKSMRAGYPDRMANYWHERYKAARDAYDLCRKKLQGNEGE